MLRQVTELRWSRLHLAVQYVAVDSLDLLLRHTLHQVIVVRVCMCEQISLRTLHSHWCANIADVRCFQRENGPPWAMSASMGMLAQAISAENHQQSDDKLQELQ